MKDFKDDIKNAFEVFPEYLLIIAGLCLIIAVFYGISDALNSFLFLLGVWAIIFIGLPLAVLVLEIINRIFGLESPKK